MFYAFSQYLYITTHKPRIVPEPNDPDPDISAIGATWDGYVHIIHS